MASVGGTAEFRTPAGCSIPFGTLELSLEKLPFSEQSRFESLLKEVERAEVSRLDALCAELQALILAKVRPPPASLAAARRLLGGAGPVICR